MEIHYVWDIVWMGVRNMRIRYLHRSVNYDIKQTPGEYGIRGFYKISSENIGSIIIFPIMFWDLWKYAVFNGLLFYVILKIIMYIKKKRAIRT